MREERRDSRHVTRRATGQGRHRRCFVALVVTTLALVSEIRSAGAADCPPHLFILARSKNANIVAYDANRGPSGDFAPSEPVVAYWLLNGEKGSREELNAIERQRAYGVDVKPGEAPGTYAMTFNASRERRFTIRMHDGCPTATTMIGGREGILQKIFVQAKEGSLPKVEYIELFGEDPANKEPLYEKFVPGK
jgi:hypothetical protein